MNPIKQNSNEKGFTLLEVLVAMLIFSIGILAVAQMQLRSLNANNDAFDQTEATMWAANKAEELIALPYASIIPDPNPYPVGGPEFLDPENQYALTWQINQDTNARSIVITVAWTKNGINKSLDFNFVKTDTL